MFFGIQQFFSATSLKFWPIVSYMVGKLMLLAILYQNARFFFNYSLGYRFLLSMWDSYDHYSRHLVLRSFSAKSITLSWKWDWKGFLEASFVSFGVFIHLCYRLPLGCDNNICIIKQSFPGDIKLWSLDLLAGTNQTIYVIKLGDDFMEYNMGQNIKFDFTF